MKRIILFATAIVFFSGAAFAQAPIRGKVVDSYTLQPITGASVTGGGFTGAVTDNKGLFSLPAATADATIAISNIGYIPQIVKLNDPGKLLVVQLTPSNKDLPEVVVSSSASNKKGLEVSNAVSMLSPQDFQRTSGIQLSQSMNNLPGIRMEQRTPAAGARILIRGYGGASNSFNTGIKVYLNDIPLTDADGTTILDDIDYTMLDKAEVIKGPSSSLYGAGIGGVVNFHSGKAPAGTQSLNERVTAGSYGLFRSNTSYQAGSTNANFLVNYGHQIYDGYQVHGRSMKDYLVMSGDFFVNEKSTISAYASFSNARDQLSGELDSLHFYTNPNWADPAYVANFAGINTQSFRFGFGHDYKITTHFSNKTTVYGSGTIIDQPFASGVNKSNKLKFGGRSVFAADTRLGSNTVLNIQFGGEYGKNYNFVKRYNLLNDSLGALSSDQEIQPQMYSVFGQADIKFSTRTILTLGASENFTGYFVKDMRLSGANGRNYSTAGYYLRFTPAFTPRIGINQLITHDISVYANLSKGYAPPLTSDIVITALNLVQTDLRPEEAVSYEIGSKGRLLKKRLSYELAVYTMDIKNKFVVPSYYVPGSTTTTYTKTMNAGKARHKGLELALNYNYDLPAGSFISLIRPFASYTYTDARYIDFKTTSPDNKVVKDSSGRIMSGVPYNVYSGGIDVESRIGLYINTTVQHSDGVSIYMDKNMQSPAYTLLNAKLGYRTVLAGHYGFDLSAGNDNITDVRYPSMIFLNRAGNPNPFLLGAPKAWYGTLSFRYIF
ncbi:MAG TPA: TonB-dependent receptor [Chitinophagaceae bacterium]|nr:TonB-dependent receptor [Chitinophagaceae bacterium]